MTSVVVDACVVIQWIVKEPDDEIAVALSNQRPRLIAPDFMPIEVANTIWKKYRLGEMTQEVALSGLELLYRLPVKRIPSDEFIADALRVALAISHPIYDCLYLALAASTGAHLATIDRKLIGAIERVPVEFGRVKVWSSDTSIS